MQLIEQSEISKIETRRKQLESNFSVFSHYEFKQAFSESYSDRIYFAIVSWSANDIEFIIPLQFNWDTIEFWWTPRADYNEILSDKRIYLNFWDIESLLVSKFGKLDIAFNDMPQKYFLNADYVSNDIYKLLIQWSYDESVPSKNVRKQIRKKINRCDRDGINLSYKLFEWKQAIHEMLPALFDLHHRKWDKTQTPSQFRDRRNVELYYKLAECESLGPQINVLF